MEEDVKGKREAAVLAKKMILCTEKTEQALDTLTETVLDRYEIIEEKISELRDDFEDLKDILVGKTGDNGLTTRVKMLEKSRGYVSWSVLAMAIGLALAVAGVWFK